MAQGDRVVIGNGSIWDDSVVVSVYQPKLQSEGELFLDPQGSAYIVRLGGVKGGTLGTIAGASIRVHRSQLFGESVTASLGGSDLVHVFPIQLDYYQTMGWIPAHHIRVVAGGVGLNIGE